METILTINKNQQFKIKQIESEYSLKQKLFTMGIHSNDIYIKSNGSRNGPVIIRNLSNNASQIALGKELASKILVEPLGE